MRNSSQAPVCTGGPAGAPLGPWLEMAFPPRPKHLFTCAPPPPSPLHPGCFILQKERCTRNVSQVSPSLFHSMKNDPVGGRRTAGRQTGRSCRGAASARGGDAGAGGGVSWPRGARDLPWAVRLSGNPVLSVLLHPGTTASFHEGPPLQGSRRAEGSERCCCCSASHSWIFTTDTQLCRSTQNDLPCVLNLSPPSAVASEPRPVGAPPGSRAKRMNQLFMKARDSSCAQGPVLGSEGPERRLSAVLD